MTDDPLRLAVAMTGAVTFGALLWRLFSTWLDATVLVHVLGTLLATSVLLTAAGTTAANADNAPANPVLWPILAWLLFCLLVSIMWPRWMHRRRAPYRRPL